MVDNLMTSMARLTEITDRAFEAAMSTREEYLARSLSRSQPWLKEGISRRTWERRRRKTTAHTSAPTAPVVTRGPAKAARSLLRRDLPANAESLARKAPRAEDDVSPMPAHKRTLRRHDEDLLMRRIHAYWDVQGMTRSDPQALAKAIHAIILPERLKDMDRWALVKIYRRARERLPAGYDRWDRLIAKWDKSYDSQMARDLVDRLVTVFDDRPLEILDRLFDHLEQQICDHLPKKVRRLELEYKRLKNNKYYLPLTASRQLPPLKTDAIKEQVYAALADGPKTKRELAQMFGKTYGAISSVGLRLRNEGKVESIWRDGRFMWTRASTAPLFIPARDAIVAALKEGPMNVPELAQNTRKGTSTVKCALHRHLLPNGKVIRSKFGTYALAGSVPRYVSKGDVIVAALKNGPMTFQALAREIGCPPSSLPQFLEPLLAKGKVIRTGRGIYALPGSAPVFVTTSDAIIKALSRQAMTLGPLVRRVNKSTNSSRSRGTVTAVLHRLKKEGAVKQDRRGGEYRLAQRVCTVGAHTGRRAAR
jgi:DNA-binding transcriptional ArsR family regulator